MCFASSYLLKEISSLCWTKELVFYVNEWFQAIFYAIESHGFDSKIWKLIKWWWRDVGRWVRTTGFCFSKDFSTKCTLSDIFDLKNNDETCWLRGMSHSHSCEIIQSRDNLRAVEFLGEVEDNVWAGAHFKVKATIERRNNVRAVHALVLSIRVFEFDFKRRTE